MELIKYNVYKNVYLDGHEAYSASVSYHDDEQRIKEVHLLDRAKFYHLSLIPSGILAEFENSEEAMEKLKIAWGVMVDNHKFKTRKSRELFCEEYNPWRGLSSESSDLISSVAGSISRRVRTFIGG